MVAFQQDVAASAHTYHLMAKTFHARGVIPRADEQDHSQEQGRKKSPNPSKAGLRLIGQSPAPTGAGRTRMSAAAAAGTEARTGAAFGTSVTMVPKTITISPIQIHATIGLR